MKFRLRGKVIKFREVEGEDGFVKEGEVVERWVMVVI